jgi:triosephosphate isomerase
MRRHLAGTGWKMNIGAAETARYAARLSALLADIETAALDIFVLPPFTSLHAARTAFAGTPVGFGGQNMHWDEAGAWTGEISAPMLAEAGCRYVELAHSERLAQFGETYALVGRKLDRALAHGLTPILCLGETAEDRRSGRTDAVLFDQVGTALAGQPLARIRDVILAYEPRWAIGAAEAASPGYVAERHAALRGYLRYHHGADAAEATRIIYGGSVNAANGPALAALPDVDGLFIGRAAWTPEGFAALVSIVAEAAAGKEMQS